MLAWRMFSLFFCTGLAAEYMHMLHRHFEKMRAGGASAEAENVN